LGGGARFGGAGTLSWQMGTAPWTWAGNGPGVGGRHHGGPSLPPRQPLGSRMAKHPAKAPPAQEVDADAIKTLVREILQRKPGHGTLQRLRKFKEQAVDT